MAAVTAGVVAAGATAFAANKQANAADKASRRQAAGIDAAQQQVQLNTERALPRIDQGFDNAITSINTAGDSASSLLRGGLQPTLSEITQGFESAQDTLSPTAEQGAGASQIQAALSGALGPEAQAAAFQNFSASPGQEFLRDRQEQALLRNEAALGGGLGQSGRVFDALQEQAFGRAQTDFGNQFNRLGQIAGRGDAATQNIAQLQASLGQARSGIRGGLAQALSGLALDQGSQVAQLQANQGQTVGNTLINQGSQQAQLAQNRGAALAGADVFRAQQPSPLLQGAQQGLQAFGLLGGRLPGQPPPNPNAQVNNPIANSTNSLSALLGGR